MDVWIWKLTMDIPLVLLFAAIQFHKAPADLCYAIHPDIRARLFDFHVQVFTKASQCIISGSITGVVQWISEIRSCRKSKSLMPKLPKQPKLQALVLMRVNDNYCHSIIPGSPTEGRYLAGGEQYHGSYDRDDCRFLCRYTKDCRAVTYGISDRSCRMFRNVSALFFERNSKFVTLFALQRGEKKPILKIKGSRSKVEDKKGNYFRRNEKYSETKAVPSASWILRKPAPSVITCAEICVTYENCSGITLVSISKPYECLLMKSVNAMYIRSTEW